MKYAQASWYSWALLSSMAICTLSICSCFKHPTSSTNKQSTVTTTALSKETPSNKKMQEQQGLPGFLLQRAYPFDEVNYEAYQDAQKAAQAARSVAQEDATGKWSLVGPVNIGGRVTDVEMHPDDLNTIYIGAASGGIFKSKDAGQNWRPIFDDALSLSIGDFAIAPSDKNTIYVGTGEANAGGGSITYDGMGVFKSINGGQTWEHLGLENSFNIGRVVVHPTNPNRVYVAAMGSLFANNKERGIFRSLDGGKTWEHTLSINNTTGCIDLVIHPNSPNILYASAWERMRRVNKRSYGGASCGIYRSTDGGKNWEKLSKGLPQENLGRIGISIASSQPNILYAIYADSIGYFKGVYKTMDGGNHWQKVRADGYLSDMYQSYGWWFGNICIDPIDAAKVYVLGLDVHFSNNGGNYWRNISGSLHYDQHSLYIHPKNPEFMVLGNDGGVYISQNSGNDWQHVKNLPITQFYTCVFDPSDARKRLGGAQDNGILRTSTGQKNDWENIYDGDGFTVMVDPENSRYLYASFQYGNLSKSRDGGLDFTEALEGIGMDDRKNWFTPIVMHPTNSKKLYYGTNFLYQSSNRADTWKRISQDLTGSQKGNNIVYGTITSISPAPNDESQIYVGTDNGKVWTTFNGGTNWTQVSDSLPNRWVTSITVHPENAAIAYVTFSGYRQTDYLPHIFETTDNGETWRDVSSNLPEAPINDILIDPTDYNNLYVATDMGVFFSEDLGDNWAMLGNNLPNVPITDLDLHPQTRQLLAATYGRSMYIYQLPEIK